MSMLSAIATPVKCSGVPTIHNVATVTLDEEYVVAKSYKCFGGHEFALTFSSPFNLPVFWECPDCEIIAAEV